MTSGTDKAGTDNSVIEGTKDSDVEGTEDSDRGKDNSDVVSADNSNGDLKFESGIERTQKYVLL